MTTTTNCSNETENYAGFCHRFSIEPLSKSFHLAHFAPSRFLFHSRHTMHWFIHKLRLFHSRWVFRMPHCHFKFLAIHLMCGFCLTTNFIRNRGNGHCAISLYVFHFRYSKCSQWLHTVLCFAYVQRTRLQFYGLLRMYRCERHGVTVNPEHIG